MHLVFDSSNTSIYNVQEVNNSFLSASLRVMYLGDNRNGSSFSKDVVMNALPSLRNVPIVCHWDPETKEIGGHDVELVREDGGDFKLRNLTVPCGTVPDHAVFRFAVEQDDAGVEHEYLIIDGVLLWKRQDVVPFIVKDLGGKVAHSMEITVTDALKNPTNGTYCVKDFQFTALCLLGSDVEPCFQGSELSVYSMEAFKRTMEQMMADLRETFTTIATPTGEDDKYQKEVLTEGGEKVLERKMKLLADNGLTPETLGFDIESVTYEELEQRLLEFDGEPAEEPATPPAENPPAGEPEDPPATGTEEPPAGEDPPGGDDPPGDDDDSGDDSDDDDEEDEPVVDDSDEEALAEPSRRRTPEEYALLAGQLVEGLIDAVSAEEIEVDGDWRMPRYWYIDHSLERNEVYCQDAEDWRLYGFEFSVDGDNVTVDFESRKRMKFTIVEWDNGEDSNAVDAVFQKVAQTYQNALTNMGNEISVLRKFKADTEEAVANSRREAVRAQFDDLTGVEAFETLCEHISEYSAEDFEEKCYAIRGRNAVNRYSFDKSRPTRLPVEKRSPESAEPYGGAFIEYGF